jgi:hypothetical protein
MEGTGAAGAPRWALAVYACRSLDGVADGARGGPVPLRQRAMVARGAMRAGAGLCGPAAVRAWRRGRGLPRLLLGRGAPDPARTAAKRAGARVPRPACAPRRAGDEAPFGGRVAVAPAGRCGLLDDSRAFYSGALFGGGMRATPRGRA